jgi:outer membrane protein insertion porin family
MMRALERRICLPLAAVTMLAVASFGSQAAGQGFGGPGGGMGSIPSSIFGKKEAERTVTGPSLSATDEMVTEIRIEGNSKIPTPQVLKQLQTIVGRPFDPALVQRDVLTLNQRGWFVDVQPSYERTPTGRVVIFKVRERPVIRYIQYIGNEKVRERKLEKETDLKMGGPIDPYVIEEARKKIVDYYHRNGFNNAQVTILEGNKPTDQGVVFVINEGTKQRIWRVVFEGAEFVSGMRLKTQIESKPPLAYMFKGYLDREQLDADVDRLTAYYRSFGFFQARIGRKIEMNEDGTWATVRFIVHEGPRYNVEDVSFIGNKVFANSSLAMLINLPAGQPFEQATMNADLQRLKDLYGSQGYVFADIKAEPIFLEEPGKLRLTYHVEEGKRWRVGRIFVHIDGETPHTRIQTVLNRLSFQPGDIVDTQELRNSERRLQASQLFLADPARGIMPKISYQIQDLETELASGSGEFRGQSPDEPGAGSREQGVLSREQGAGSREQGAGSGEQGARSGERGVLSYEPSGSSRPMLDGPPLIAPPSALGAAAKQTIAVPPPAGFVDHPDQMDVHLYVDQSGPRAAPGPAAASQTGSDAIQSPSATAQRYEVRRPPFEDPFAAPQPAASAYQRVSTQGNAYQRVEVPRSAGQLMVVRGQNPTQAPVERAPYFETGYGGQTVGATGPAAAGIGANGYAVQQAAAAPMGTGQAVIPVQYTTPPGGVPQNGAPMFAPPPLPPPQYGTPQPVGPPLGPPQAYPPGTIYAPPQYGAPAGALPPDPNITPLRPIPTNPQPLPGTPYDPFTPSYDQGYVDVTAAVSENQTGRLMLGVAVNSDAGLVGQILLDEQNFDWTRLPTSWDDFASGRAFRGAGQRFRLEAAPGTEVHRYLVSFSEPYLMDYPVSFMLSGSFFDRRYVDWDEQRLGGRVGFGYQWTANDVGARVSYRGESIKISDIGAAPIPELAEVEGSNALHGFMLAVTNDTRDSVFLATEGHYLEVSVEQVVGTFDYPRGTFDARKYFLLHERPDHSGRHVLTTATQVGITGNHTPIYENFFAGGFTTLRGFDFRGVGPVKGASNVRVGGEFMWVNTVEYLFPLTADDMMHGVVFTDFGTVEEDVEIEDFRVAAGFGLRVTVPAMGPAPIALDFAWPIKRAPFDDTQVFSFFMGFTR